MNSQPSWTCFRASHRGSFHILHYLALVYARCRSFLLGFGLIMPGFYVNIPVGAVAALAMVFLRIPEETIKPKPWILLPRIHHYLDLVGFFLFAPAVLQLLLALQFGSQAYPWNSSRVIGLLCGAAANAVVWGFWNRYRGDDAMIPRSMTRRWNVLLSGIYVAFQTSAVYGGIYYLPLYFQAINGASAILSGVYLLPMIISQLIVAGLSGVAGKSDIHSII